jgi:cation transport ATPase
MGKWTIRRFVWRGLICAPIGIAYVFGWLHGYFSRPAYIAVGLALAVLFLIGSVMAQRAWGRRKRRLEALRLSSAGTDVSTR